MCPGFLKGTVRPTILLLVAQNEGIHGYELASELESLGLDLGGDNGRIYRILRRLEEAKLVTSKWDTTGSGPARRRYDITRAGIGFLRGWRDSIDRTRHLLDFLDHGIGHLESEDEDETKVSV
ncbi:MAG: helix-turn-helix transcriptional regulator, partial [Bacillota bacterium]